MRLLWILYLKSQAVWSRILAAFHYPSFKWLWISSVFGSMSFAANHVVMGWLVFETTNSAFWVGAVGAAMGVGQVGFGIFAGVLLDRFDKRYVLIIFQLIGAILPLVIGILVLSEQIALWHLFLANLIIGVISAVRAPAFNTITFQLVGKKGILNAVAAMNMSSNFAGILSPLVTGILIDQFNESGGFFLATVFGLIGVASISQISGNFQTKVDKEPMLKAAISGLQYVWAHAKLRQLVSLSLIVETFGFSYRVMLPVIAQNVLGLDATGYGVLSSARSIGATLGTLFIASLGDYKHKGWLLLYSVTGAGITIILFGLSPFYSLSLILVTILGAMMTSYDTTMRSLVLMLAGDAWRGRVQSIYTLTYGFLPVGGFVTGTIAELIGVSYALVINGGILVSFINLFSQNYINLSGQEDHE